MLSNESFSGDPSWLALRAEKSYMIIAVVFDVADVVHVEFAPFVVRVLGWSGRGGCRDVRGIEAEDPFGVLVADLGSVGLTHWRSAQEIGSGAH